ncbi:MAG: hypothetical protein ACXVLQ_11365 [Bacteriovorax sp.]
MKRKLVAKTIKVGSLYESQIVEMFSLFELSYENISFDRFQHDLKAKSRVILLFDKNKKIQGFSTLFDFDFFHNKKNYRILYSGDTLISPDYWGTSALTMEFLRNIILLKVRYPTRPVWWFLISKGYKTYLLLANNFINYYPRFDRETPLEYQSLLQELSEKLYPGKFNKKTGIIEFGDEEHDHLKDTIAPITEELMEKYPKIKFFQEKNPDWRKGNELACIGEVDPLLGLVHPIKIVKKILKKRK